MKVLVFEDTDDKFVSIEQGLIRIGVDQRSIKRAKSLASGVRELRSMFDLYIIDLWLPMVDNGDDVDVTKEIVSLLDQGKNLQSPVVAITSFAAEAEKHSSFLASKGVHIYDFHSTDIWQRALTVFMQQAEDRHRYDFIIFTALDEERRAYSYIEGVETKSVTRAGLSFWDFEFGGKKGSIVLSPRMGLVTASIATAKVLENYAPKVVCMSGICAGMGKETYLGQLLVTELCWEYQSGKWLDDSFSAEPYQVEIADSLRTYLAQYIDDTRLPRHLEAGFEHGSRPGKVYQPKLAMFASGSAVIASEKRLNYVKEQQRKVSGIDMEIYGFHRAARMCNEKVVVFSAKTVVDKADENKDDDLHAYGSFVSARFCLETISNLFASGMVEE